MSCRNLVRGISTYRPLLNDVSRIYRSNALNKLRRKLPIQHSDPEAAYLKQSRFFRRVLSKYGQASGVEPGIAWSHRDELHRIIDDENKFDLTLKQKIETIVDRKKKEIESFQNLVKETDNALKKMPKQIDAFYEKIKRKEKQELDRVAQKKEVLEQAREYYGYEVDLRDPRIQEMIEKIQEEKKAEEKKKREEERKKQIQASALQKKLKEAEQILKQTGKDSDTKQTPQA